MLIVLAVLLLLGLVGAYCPPSSESLGCCGRGYWKRRKGGSTVPLTPSKPEAGTLGAVQGKATDEEGAAMSEAARQGIPKYWGRLEFKMRREILYVPNNIYI